MNRTAGPGELDGEPPRSLGTALVLRTWWPLAASWLMMGLELPALSAVVARLAEPKVNLAAFGGVVFPVALIIESPIIMMLAASTALSRDHAAYRRLYRFMWRLSAGLTALHALVAFTPCYDLLVVNVMGVPDEIVEPGRLGLRLMLPWTWAIADRRFQQGVLIRFGRSRAVGIGTLIRVVATGSALLVGLAMERVPGVAVAATALSIGVITEAVYARIAVAPVLRGPLRASSDMGAPLTLRSLLVFYVPLALTPLLGLLSQPIGSASMSRMPDALDSLAAWPAVSGLLFVTRSFGIAFNEVVVTLADRPGALRVLRRFAVALALTTSSCLLILAVTPLGRGWFSDVCGLGPELTALAGTALWLGILLPTLTSAQSYYQGILVNHRSTRAIPESMVLFLVIAGGLLGVGVWWNQVTGLYVTLVAMTIGLIAQTLWVAVRCRPIIRAHAAMPHDDAHITAGGAPEFTE